MTADFREYGLSEEILRALDTLGYKEPTEVQREVIPAALQGKDITVKSRTGSGKTAAYGIPICERVEWEENRPQALVLTPTRELADQVKEDLTNIGRFKRIRVTALYGKQPFAKQKTELMQKVHIVVGTPGRVMDHIEKDTLNLERVSMLVLDEADEMLSMGFIEQVEAILRELPEDRVTMLFSATLPKGVEELCHRYMVNPVDIEIASAGRTTAGIDHSLFLAAEGEKPKLLQDVLVTENPDACILFCRTQAGVDGVFDQLDGLGYSCGKIHGGMEQDDRFAVMHAFRRGEFRFLAATDVAARGIDIDNITHVINYDLPLDKESYVHRTGRTGRAGREGIAISFVTPEDQHALRTIEEYLGQQIRRREAPSAEEVEASRDAFEAKMKLKPAPKQEKKGLVDRDIMQLYFSGGKKKKIRTVDLVGTLTKIDGMTAGDIGIINILDNVSYVDILNGKGPMVIEAMKTMTVKGKQLKVHEAVKKR
ncbi:DEAD/DEAH box helicase [Paenibacillus mucilaginosus]|uniref:ATP-dependent RNA helicase DbpA n=1 Tax=Paenibacillus mucilaginosus (strain KNP414) TaxID=1036673 RepID=F8FKM5_PAEMK|nr:DEAD/DEAH box helicase [Paenibacillus mucilaginosus]AEI46393.1 DbpA [Paenibacillus mucilaginosus KNP414]MCG7213496.1 DEAD/DEAH box helicase [Paenibacillus mucilaginosus]WDM27686.1 DEAD/DEAH box helicase [Paenibacillus mucilaginosus]